MDWLDLIFSVSGSWLTLMVTGRIFTYISSDTHATWKEDAQASAVIAGLTFLASLGVMFIGLPAIIVPAVYIYLIFQAFQLEGIFDLITFYILHVLINAAVMWFGFIPIGLALQSISGDMSRGTGGLN